MKSTERYGVKIRLHTLLAVLTAAPLLLAAAGCGSKPPSGSPETGAGAGTVATTPASSPVTLAETGSTLLYPLFNFFKQKTAYGILA